MNNVALHTSDAVKSLTKTECLELIEPLTYCVKQPFDEDVKEILGKLSKRLLASPFGRHAPQILALGFWLRPAAIEALQKLHHDNSERKHMVARGLAYQLPPANVDTLFAYSWALSFLVGNSNVTRLPSDLNPISKWILDQILECVNERDQNVRQLFLSFDKASTIGHEISQHSDIRVIWGGDAKIRAISTSPTRPDGLTIGFSDRKSICLIDIEAYNSLDSDERMRLAEKFYNDIYWFDQMGCSSPRLLGWVGSGKPSCDLFFSALQETVRNKNYDVDCGVDISKFVYANRMAALGIAKRTRRHCAELIVLDAESKSSLLDHVHGGGALWQVQIPDLGEIESLIRRDLQTISTFGFSSSEKIELSRRLNGRGGYRIVPIGEALNFDSIWDGIDLIRHLSRIITIK